ncbi:MAG: sulfatase [Acidobacteriota bacterium]
MSPSLRASADRLPCRRLLILAVLFLTVATGCGESGSQIRPRRAVPDQNAVPLIFISLDTFRADALGVQRRGRPSISPALDRFAEDAVIFRHAVAPMPFTLPSHITMFTGVQPGVHRVTTEKDRLSTALRTLPEILQAAGYRTDGRVTNDWLKADFGFARGFDSYDRIPHRLTYADRLNREALGLLPKSKKNASGPFFLFLHYMDPHSDFTHVGRNRLPYWSPEEVREELAFGDDAFCDAENRCATAYLLSADRENRPVPEEELIALKDLYEAGIRGLDAELGDLFDELRRRGLYDPALIVVTSDHGEEFREHGRFLHSQVYEESVAVPLLIKLPGSRRAGQQVRPVVRLSDLLPTLTELLGLPTPPHVQGQSLVPLIEEGPWQGLPALSQDKLVRSRFGLRTRSHKLIYEFKTGAAELYDLRTDPGERNNLAQEQPELTERMTSRLRAEVRDGRLRAKELPVVEVEGDSQLTAEERERLRSLGYL